jgi:hypothetical protein
MLIKEPIEYIILVKGKRAQLEDPPSPPFTMRSIPLATNKYWQEDISPESQFLVLSATPSLIPLGSPLYQPLLSCSTSHVSQGTSRKLQLELWLDSINLEDLG